MVRDSLEEPSAKEQLGHCVLFRICHILSTINKGHDVWMGNWLAAGSCSLSSPAANYRPLSVCPTYYMIDHCVRMGSSARTCPVPINSGTYHLNALKAII